MIAFVKHRRARLDHQRPRHQAQDSGPARPPPERGAAAPAGRPPGDIVFGVEPIRELLAAAATSVRVLYVDRREPARFAAEAERVRGAGGQVVETDQAALARLAGSRARHQGLVALVREYDYADLEATLARAPDPLLLIDGVTDPRNLGALLRSAEGAGVDSVILARDRTAGLTPAAIKASAGAWVHLAIARCGNVVRTLELLKRRGYWIAALVPGAALSLYEIDAGRRLALVVGAEDHGVRELVKKSADFLVAIPMYGKVGSLNVSVAAAVALYELRRRRAAPGGA